MKDSKEDLEEGFSVFTHRYVPMHEVLSHEEAKKIMARFNAKPEQFPYILASDPAAKEVKAKPGDLIRIRRRSDTAGEMVYYRYVVEE